MLAYAKLSPFYNQCHSCEKRYQAVLGRLGDKGIFGHQIAIDYTHSFHSCVVKSSCCRKHGLLTEYITTYNIANSESVLCSKTFTVLWLYKVDS